MLTDVWSYIEFNHPTTFDTLAMDPARKKTIMDDLDDFRNSRDYYNRIGKAWKRGYLLYGPPGTDKSTMIAAMANYLDYDIYDIELTTLRTNSDLRKLFVETTGKSVVVIEDIDCSLDLTGSRGNNKPPPRTPRPRPQDDGGGGSSNDMVMHFSKSMVTLSGLLNFTNGLWSAHSGERVIVFTTNYVHQLDPALISRGRMDMHTEMSYCKFEAFKTLANNYLGLDKVDDDAHPMFDAIKELLQAVEIAPADVAECLMASAGKERDADTCLRRLLDELKNRTKKKKASEAEKEREGGRVRKQGQDKVGGQGRRPLTIIFQIDGSDGTWKL